MLRLPVIRFPRKFNIGLLRQHHTLLGKRRGVVTGFPPQIAEGMVLGLSALHGRCYSRFFWNALVLYERGIGLAETLQDISINSLNQMAFIFFPAGHSWQVGSSYIPP
jgi:hypothetical protein